MRLVLFALFAALVSGAAGSSSAEENTAPDVTVTDGAAVFQKAFWKRPTTGDRILHAERREWLDASGVSRWQWFLVIQPSPEIVRYLREENAFRLRKTDTMTVPRDAPEWFVSGKERSNVMASAGDVMQLAFTAGDARIYAVGSGGGFRPGVPETPAGPAAAAAETGRLPASPPPITEKP